MRWIVFILLLMLGLLGCGSGESGGGSFGVEHLVEGTGMQPTPRDTVEVHYHGTLEDGTVFDSSVERGQMAKFPLTRVIRCWTQGIPQMKVGGKAILTCPPEMAYGEKGTGSIPANATLTFEVELFGVY
ncbi:MAG: FKBP-type peptidyl-prolyl cis-trans isomerase [Deltaproteobacteria bacterium]|nr:FKBP-type peptidyl-prolyl cis-trans isomerase [Deltaproteobacteria bacterium]